MQAEQWKEIEKLFEASIELEPGQRADFLAEACANDQIRRKVELLLAARGKEPSFIERPALDLAAEIVMHSDAESRVGRTIEQYQVLSVIGAGGMGVVYRARDTKLGRDVALKILPDEFSQDPERVARSEREARLLASLNHPNIAAIYDMKEWKGNQCLVLEYIQGETLAEKLKRSRVPVAEGLDICRQVARALEAAHEQGIVHRDVKPGNVMITTNGGVKVLDFGIAKSLTESDSRNDPAVTPLTQAGLILGTPAYLSPEQVRGEPGDKHGDIFAFGCVLYELLAGQPPFSGGSIVDIIASVLKMEPDWSALSPDTPPRVRDLLQSCLQKESYRRLQNISEARAEIEAALRALTVVPEPDRAIRSLAVLPFVNTSGDPEMEYLSDGLTQSIISNLSQLPQLRVMSHSAVVPHKGRSGAAQEAGRELGVSAVLTGRVLQRGETLQISAELVDVENGWQLWGNQYKRKSADIFATEEDIAKEISGTLRLKLTPEKRNLLAKRSTEQVEAYHLYLKGRHNWGKRTEEGLRKAIQFFRQAIDHDPTYALAYAGLAEGYVPLAYYGYLAPHDVWPKAKAAANRALEIDPDLSEARVVLGSFKTVYEWDLPGAEKELRTAIQLDPNYPRARQSMAEYLTLKKQFAEAAAEVRLALEMDPLSLHMNAAVVMHSYFGRRYDEATEHGRSAVELDPTFYPTRFYLGLAYAQKQQYAEAAAELQQARALSDNSTLMVASLGAVFAAWGKEADARNILAELQELSRRKHVSQASVAAIFAGLDDKDQAFAALERAYSERSTWLLYCLSVDPRFDSLRDEARFRDLVRRVGL